MPNTRAASMTGRRCRRAWHNRRGACGQHTQRREEGGMSDGETGAWHDVEGTPDDPNALRGRRVLVMGLGLLGGGVAAVRYAVEHGAAEVIATDLRSAEVLAPSLTRLDGLPIRYVLGHHDTADFERADVVVRNPGV